MISVRYCHSHELSPGLNASVECSRRGTVVYLVPGLTREERHSAVRRLRMASRVGAGPKLPAAQLALALLADRIRTAAWRAGAIFRLHPAGSALPVLLLSIGVIVFLALSAVSIQVLPEQAAGRSPVLGPGPAAAAGATHERRSAFDPVNLVRVGPPGPPGLPGPRGGSAGRTRPGSSSSHSGSASRGPGGRGPGGRGPGGRGPGGRGPGGRGSAGGNGPTLTGSADPARTPGAVTGESSPAGTPTPTPTPSPSPAASGGTCLQVGPLGFCLSL